MPSLNPHILFSLAEIGIFPCPACSKPMRLSRIDPGEPGFCGATIKMGIRIAAFEIVPEGRFVASFKMLPLAVSAVGSKPLAKRASQRAVASERLAGR